LEIDRDQFGVLVGRTLLVPDRVGVKLTHVPDQGMRGPGISAFSKDQRW
jgi:hypothetical protein